MILLEKLIVDTGNWTVEVEEDKDGGVMELLSHRDNRASWIVSAFIVGDCNNETKAQREEHS